MKQGKTTLIETLVQHPGLINDRIYKPLVGIANTYYVKMDTKSHQGRDRAISLTDTPTYSNFKALSWIHASQVTTNILQISSNDLHNILV